MPTTLEGSNEPSNETDFDTTSALADISADLFGQGESSSDAGGAEGLSKEVPDTSSQSVEPSSADQTSETSAATETETKSTENSQEVQGIGAPKTWTKEALETWATLPPRAQQEILKREQDFLNGITQYKAAAEVGNAYSKVVEPYAPMLERAGIDPVQLFNSFASNHYLLSRGTPEQKLELATQLILGYGIDFESLIHHVGQRNYAPVDPRVAALEQEIQQLKHSDSSRRQQEESASLAKINSEIEAFAKDPAHPYFDQLVNDIGTLLQSGQAANLQEAYDRAAWSNPQIREELIAQSTAEKTKTLLAEQEAQRTKVARATAADVNINHRPGNGTIPVGSIDDTLSETLARIRSAG